MGKQLESADHDEEAQEVELVQKKVKKQKKRQPVEDEEEVEVEQESASSKSSKKKAPKADSVADSESSTDNAEPAKKKKKKASKDASESAESQSGSTAHEDDDAANTYRKEHLITSEGDTRLPAPLESFDALPFDKKIVSELKKAGFSTPSPIQAQGWPVVLDKMDLIAIAKTGSGKTLGFLLPLFHRMLREADDLNAGGPQCLVLAPTRELAMQIKTECDRFGACVGIRACCIYGGVPLGPQKAELKKQLHVIIATPGRLNDMLSQNAVTLKSARFLVMDEADRMLDMGFEPQIKTIVAQLPAARQTLFFTATWPKSVRRLAATYLAADAVHVHIGGGADHALEANKAISQEFYQVTDDAKDAKLWEIIQGLPEGSRMVCFANTKRRVDYLAKALWDEGLGTCAIHGDRSQTERDDALKRFTNGEYPLMFATDVAARGLDIKGVTHVLNFDMARDVESYVHRIGRTGRAGLTGKSITFWNPDYDKECAPALAKIAVDAGCPVPDWLQKYATGKASKAWKPENAVLTI